MTINETHDPGLRSFVQSANAPSSDFPIQNLPFGVFRRAATDESPRLGVAIGNRILDLGGCHGEGLLTGVSDDAAQLCSTADSLNALMTLDGATNSSLRKRISEMLRHDSADADAVTRHLLLQSDVEMLMPATIGDYTDYYASIYHATNVGSMFRPDNPLLPNYKWVPIAYHGRASSIVPSGTPIRRPHGQTRDDQNAPPVFGPTRRLDYEMEVGIFIGRGNELDTTVPIDRVPEHIFGLCIVNDWSARDVQTWEYQPLGPFLAKNFATTVSPWIVTLEALEPFRVAAFQREEGDPQPLPYLLDANDQERGGIDLTVEVRLESRQMRERGIDPVRLSRGNLRDMYWTVSQMVAHHASNGCNLRSGDLLASGTISGREKDSRGCLLELTWRGTEPLVLPTGETRRFLEDGDEVIMRGYCERPGAARIGFGECRGIVIPA
jgi:fumarylacetoacetase